MKTGYKLQDRTPGQQMRKDKIWQSPCSLASKTSKKGLALPMPEQSQPHYLQ
jgi:hypothetical protein